MGLATLKLDESSKLAFGVQITGAGGVPEARFIIEGKDFNIAFPCKQTNEGVEVEISGLKNVLSSGEYQARLEVILENKVYTPMRDTITFEPTVEISTKAKPVASVKESVTVSKVIVHKPDPEKPRLEIANYIANTLGYTPRINESAASIINHSLEQCPAEVSPNVFEAVNGMISLAESEGIRVDRGLMPSQKIVVVEQAMEVKPEPTQRNADDGEVSDEELEDMISHIQDWDDIVDAYDPDELALIDDDTGEVIDDDLSDDLKEEALNEVLSRAERLKARVRFARTAAKRQRRAKIALKKHSSSATLTKRARRLAVKTMETKLAKGKPLGTLSVPEKERIERIIQKRKAMISRLAMKLTPRVKKIEQNRLAHKSFTKN
jgi:hypothetical protein